VPIPVAVVACDVLSNWTALVVVAVYPDGAVPALLAPVVSAGAFDADVWSSYVPQFACVTVFQCRPNPADNEPETRTVRLEMVVVLVAVTASANAFRYEKFTPAVTGIGTGVVPVCVSTRLKVIPVSALAPAGSVADAPKYCA